MPNEFSGGRVCFARITLMARGVGEFLRHRPARRVEGDFGLVAPPMTSYFLRPAFFTIHIGSSLTSCQRKPGPKVFVTPAQRTRFIHMLPSPGKRMYHNWLVEPRAG